MPRTADRAAIIPDARNDENINLSQLQYAMIASDNAVHDKQTGSGAERMIRARQLRRWAFRYVTIQDWLKCVCEPLIVDDTLANGPRFFGTHAGRSGAFMPLEFSGAAFRFAHSLIRPAYQSSSVAPLLTIDQVLAFAGNGRTFFDRGSSGVDQLTQQFVIDWNFLAPGGSSIQFARKIDTTIAQGLGLLPFQGRVGDPVLGHLARSNLMRGKNLSIPIGQAVADALGVHFLKPGEITAREDAPIVAILEQYGFHQRTPLSYYVLREAAVQQDGERLGEVGNPIVRETIIGFVKLDFNSHLNAHETESAIKNNGIEVMPGPGGRCKNIADILKIAGVF